VVEGPTLPDDRQIPSSEAQDRNKAQIIVFDLQGLFPVGVDAHC
jgi:hypothetical protein